MTQSISYILFTFDEQNRRKENSGVVKIYVASMSVIFSPLPLSNDTWRFSTLPVLHNES